MKNISIIIAATIAAFSFNASAEELSIKGYMPGQSMSACPENSISNPERGMLFCSLGPTSYAGAEASDHTVVIYNNEIIGAVVKLKDRGRYASSGVLAALKEKFGNPTESKSHLNAYRWQKGSIVFSFDGYSGLVLLMDVEKHRAASDIRAKENKNDL